MTRMKLLLPFLTWSAFALSATSGSASTDLNWRTELLEWENRLGQKITAQIRVPVVRAIGRSPGAMARRQPTPRYPALLVFGGFQEAAKVLTLLSPDFPIILASFDYPFSPPRKFEFPGSLRFGPEVKAMGVGTLEGIRHLRAKLSERPDVDPAKITVVGASLGAPFAVAAAAQDPALKGLVIVHGFGDLSKTAMHQLGRSWERKWVGWKKPLAWPLAWLVAQFGGWYLDFPEPETMAGQLRTGQSALMIQASEDTFIPKECSDSLWNGLQKSSAQVERWVMPGDHIQPGSDRLIKEIMMRIAGWMNQVALR